MPDAVPATIEAAIVADLPGFAHALELAEMVFEPAFIPTWLHARQARFGDRSPLDLIIAGEGDEVIDLLASLPLLGTEWEE